jgi:methyl-accepting chemotaxis protein
MTWLAHGGRADVGFTAWLTLAQAVPPDWATQLERIMWAQIVMAGVMVVCALAVLAAALAVFVLVRRTTDRIEAAKDQLLPHVTPVLSRAATIADDVGHMTAGFRDNADDVQETIQDLLERTRGAVDALDERVRRFGAVLEAVQDQAELLLMDATSSARGAHRTARALREEQAHRARGARRDVDD